MGTEPKGNGSGERPFEDEKFWELEGTPGPVSTLSVLQLVNRGETV